jgi:methylated-DNA-[protein]-cysteine S-methyltransferase
LSYVVFETDLGWMGVLGSARGVREVILPQATSHAVSAIIGKDANQVSPRELPFGDLPARLTQHLSGTPQEFPDKVDLPDATPFHMAVWETVYFIPAGQTRSYSWVARQVARPTAARAVGQAMARNPVPIIVPCHRVIGADGRLGGFGGGLWLKRRLLKIEAFNPSTPPMP